MASPNPDIAVFEAVASQDAKLHWYAIADSAQHPDLPAVLAERGGQVRCLFGASEGSPVARQAPHLVELHSPLEGGTAWRWIGLKGRSKPCVSVIAAKTGFDALFSQLSECTEVVLPDGDEMFFAFWDPAILGTLIGQPDDLTLHVAGPVLDPDQRSMLTADIAAWWYWDRAGSMHSIALARCGSDAPTGPIRLTQIQVDDLVEASVPDHVLYYVELNQPLLIAEVPPAKRYETVRQALVRARDIGLLTMGDLVNFVCVDLIYKERMREDQAILNLLHQIKQGKLGFHDALAELP